VSGPQATTIAPESTEQQNRLDALAPRLFKTGLALGVLGLVLMVVLAEFDLRLKEATGADIRCFIIGGKVIATMKRQAGEPHRFNPEAINLGVKGILRVMNELGMRRIRRRYRPRQSMEARHRSWGRARRGGILRLQVKLGRWVSKHQTIAVIHDAFGEEKITQLAPCDGLVIGHTNNPLVNQGDAVLHLARDVTTHGP
jgi:hypothetical protein